MGFKRISVKVYIKNTPKDLNPTINHTKCTFFELIRSVGLNPVSSGFDPYGRHPHEVYVLRTSGLNPIQKKKGEKV